MIEPPRQILQWTRQILDIMTIVAPCGIVAAGLFVSPWPAQRFLIFYVAPLALAVLLWSRIRIQLYADALGILAFVDALVLLLAFVRTLGIFPFSGHMLFIAYSFLSTRVSCFRIVAIALALETTIFKLIIWHDFGSWSLGLLLGIVLGILYNSLSRRISR